MPTVNDASTTELLQQAFPVPVAATEGAAAPPSSGPVCAQLMLFARTQYMFYVGFQTLVLALSVAVLVALVLFIVRLTGGVDVTGVVGAPGRISTAVAAVFLQTQANEAKKRYDAALEALQNSGC